MLHASWLVVTHGAFQSDHGDHKTNSADDRADIDSLEEDDVACDRDNYQRNQQPNKFSHNVGLPFRSVRLMRTRVRNEVIFIISIIYKKVNIP